MRTASIEVRKFNSLREAPVVVLNKQRRRGDRDGCIIQNNTHNQIRKKAQSQFTVTQNEENLGMSTWSPAPTIARRLELNNISTITKAPTATGRGKNKNILIYIKKDWGIQNWILSNWNYIFHSGAFLYWYQIFWNHPWCQWQSNCTKQINKRER